jgi:hypothetical protein
MDAATPHRAPGPRPDRSAAPSARHHGDGTAGRPRRGWRTGALAVAIVGAVVLGGCSTTPGHPSAAPTTAATSSTAPAATCPLTGAPVPGGGPVPARPALGIKVDNYTSARPQTGLNKADIVVEEPVEGGITRFVAIFQCQQAVLVGPVRSARNIDIGILGQFGAHPLLAHVGGIDPVIDDIDNSPLVNLDLGAHASAIFNPPGRVAPYDTYTTTADMWALTPFGDDVAPSPVFSYSPKPQPGGKPAQTVAIPFSGTSNVVWHYDAKISAYQRYYGDVPDTLTNGGVNTAANIVVQFVNIYYGPWLENSEGGLEVQADLYQDATGFAAVFRSGVEIPGSWSRNALGTPTAFVNMQGQPITLQPGPTWIELVPSAIPVSVTP